MKSWIFRYITAMLFLLTICLSLSATSRMERYKRVLQKTADDFNIQGTVKVTGSETDDFYMLEIQPPLVSESSLNKGVGLNFTSFPDKKTRKAFFSIAEAFGEAAKEIYGSVPSVSQKTRVLEGVKILESDCPAYTYKSAVMKVTMPRTRGMRVDITSLISFSVTTMGGPDPEPYMAQLLKNLKEAGLLEPIEEGVSFRVLAEKDGYIPGSRVVDTGDISPSSITVTGQVIDVQGKPVQGAKVMIPSLKETGITDTAGHFRLSAETKGSKPFSTSFTLTLETPTTGMMVSFENPVPLPVPGNSTVKIVAKDDKGDPVKAGRVKLKWTAPDFVTAPVTTGKLDRDGTLVVPVHVYTPSDPGTMLPEPSSLQVKLEVEVIPEDGGKSGSAILEVPLNLSMIIGTTVGPDMKPRPENNAPRLFRMAQLLLAGRVEDGSGKFRVLVHPL
ncbi:MAG: hypothetical protein KAH24_02635, partial [Holophagae bacterium]|nr:hypothetical protein [Holophagae bacterium]